MRIINKENLQKKMSFNFDPNSYKIFLNKVSSLAKELEYKSDIKKLKYSVVINAVRIPYIPCKGITSRIVDSDGRITHCGMFDWDNILEKLLLDEARFLSSLVNQPIFIFKTFEKFDCNNMKYGNYMGIVLSKKPLFDWIKINGMLSTDINHSIVSASYRYKAYVLRMSHKGELKPKPEFCYIIDNGKKEFPDEISNSHKEFLEAAYPEIKELNKKYKFNLDDNNISNLDFVSYKTGSG